MDTLEPKEPGAAEAVPLHDVLDVLPHRDTMLLLDAIVQCTTLDIEARARVRADAWYADREGAMPAWIGIELMAQAIAAHVGLLAMREGGRARPGVLLGTSGYRAHRFAFEADATLSVTARELLRSEAGHGAYDCAIHLGGVCCAEAVVKVYQPDDFQTFIEGSLQS
ncbi:ApeP family dehydratase [Burkholderia plantarii]|uniref:ApeP family dehydratase n=1 Tax=Burkholderia plantarii TaxID=41899 RepID=UPI000870AC83|nr:beta-hydroxyacyl-ACP dehydratase [Burkholderia plantarii]